MRAGQGGGLQLSGVRCQIGKSLLRNDLRYNHVRGRDYRPNAAIAARSVTAQAPSAAYIPRWCSAGVMRA